MFRHIGRNRAEYDRRRYRRAATQYWRREALVTTCHGVGHLSLRPIRSRPPIFTRKAEGNFFIQVITLRRQLVAPAILAPVIWLRLCCAVGQVANSCEPAADLSIGFNHGVPNRFHVNAIVLMAEPVPQTANVVPWQTRAQNQRLIAEPHRRLTDHRRLAFHSGNRPGIFRERPGSIPAVNSSIIPMNSTAAIAFRDVAQG
jgi:hypothetical protein